MLAKSRMFADYAGSCRTKDTWKRAGPSEVIGFCHDTSRGYQVDGKAYSLLTDSILDEFESQGSSVQSFSLWGSRLVGERAWRQPHSLNRSYTLTVLISVFVGLFTAGKLELKNRGQSQVKLFQRILYKTGARVVIAAMPPEPLLRACRNLGVVLVEVCHGFGYRSLPRMYQGQGASLPRVFLARDDVTFLTLNSLASRGVSVLKMVPFPGSRFDDSLSPPNQASGSLESRVTAPQKRLRRALVAVSHGGTLDEPYIDLKLLENLVRAGGPDIEWGIRLHPTQLKSPRFRKFRKDMDQFVAQFPNCEWERSSRTDSLTAVGSADVLLTHFSEIVYDAAFAGVASGILLEEPVRQEFEQFRQFPELVASGHLRTLNSDPDLILAWIKEGAHHNPLSSLDRPLAVSRVVRTLLEDLVRP